MRETKHRARGTTITWPQILIDFEARFWKLNGANLTLTEARELKWLLEGVIADYVERYGEEDPIPQ